MKSDAGHDEIYFAVFVQCVSDLGARTPCEVVREAPSKRYEPRRGAILSYDPGSSVLRPYFEYNNL